MGNFVLTPIEELSFDGSLEINLSAEFGRGVDRVIIPLNMRDSPNSEKLNFLREMAHKRGYDLSLVSQLPNYARHTTALSKEKIYSLEFSKKSGRTV